MQKLVLELEPEEILAISSALQIASATNAAKDIRKDIWNAAIKFHKAVNVTPRQNEQTGKKGD